VNRIRRAVRFALAATLAVAACCVPASAAGPAAAPAAADSTRSLDALIARARAEGWNTLPIGERVARFGLALEGAPYLDRTLEGPGPEVCRVPVSGFDCVTFMELCLDLARVTGGERAAGATAADVRAAVTFTRYRGGRLTDYTSRLHYTSEWIADNVAKGVLDDVTPSLGGVPCPPDVGFMSAHPDRYPALVAEPAFVDSMRRIEAAVRATARTCIPRDSVAAVEASFRSGDLVAIATSIGGLDYAHTGMIVRDASGVARFLHASSRHGRVFLDGPLSGYLANGPNHHTGVTIVRPREMP